MAETGDMVRVLYVEDDPEFAELSATLLEREETRITVQTAPCAEDGLSRLQDCLPDCIISDYNMSEMNGIEFLKTVRETYPDLPFILFTGQGSEQVASEAISAGVTDYLQKETGTEQYTILANRVMNAVEQYRYRNQLQEERERVSALFDNSSDAIAYCEFEGEDLIIREVNPAFESTFGYEAETAIGNDIDELVVPENHQPRVEQINRRLRAGESPTRDVRRETVNGTRDFALRPIPLKPGESGERAYVIYTDITERKQREQELRQFREAVEQTAHAVYITDVDGTIEYVNPAFEELTGYSEEEVLGQTPRILQSGKHDEDFYEKFWERITAGEQWESEITDRREDGEQVIFYQTVSPITDDDGEPQKFVAVAREITKRKEHENTLEQAREELRQVIDLVPDLIFAKNRAGEYLLANETTAEAYGLTPEEVEGSKESDIIPEIEDSEVFREDDIEVIESGESKFIPEEELTTADGDTRILQTTKIPYEVPGTGENAVLGYGRDVTDLKTYEQKLETQRDNLDILNQVVRHDIRNDLQVISIYAEALEPFVVDGGEEYISKILEAINHPIELTETAKELTEVMLHSDIEHSSVGLESVLEREIDTIRSTHEQASITVEGPIPAVEILANDMLGSVFRNLLNNAIQHNDSESPEITVSTTLSDDTVSVSISDNGPGIPDEHREEIFAKGESGLDSTGTGLGLYLVQTLVTQYDGTVRVEDNEPEGAVFTVELPIAD